MSGGGEFAILVKNRTKYEKCNVCKFVFFSVINKKRGSQKNNIYEEIG